MAEGKYKPCSFYVPERDTELMRFMQSQSNMSLSMRLLMKAFLASNRHQTDIDVGTMDLYDLIRSMRVDPELFEDVPRRTRPMRSISAIEAEELRAAASNTASAPGPGHASQDRAPVPEATHVPEPAPERQPAPEPVPAPVPRPESVREPVPAPVPDHVYAPGPAPADGDDLDPMAMMGEGY